MSSQTAKENNKQFRPKGHVNLGESHFEQLQLHPKSSAIAENLSNTAAEGEKQKDWKLAPVRIPAS